MVFIFTIFRKLQEIHEGKNAVSALNEYCQQKKLAPPFFHEWQIRDAFWCTAEVDVAGGKSGYQLVLNIFLCSALEINQILKSLGCLKVAFHQ